MKLLAALPFLLLVACQAAPPVQAPTEIHIPGTADHSHDPRPISFGPEVYLSIDIRTIEPNYNWTHDNGEPLQQANDYHFINPPSNDPALATSDSDNPDHRGVLIDKEDWICVIYRGAPAVPDQLIIVYCNHGESITAMSKAVRCGRDLVKDEAYTVYHEGLYGVEISVVCEMR
jgi:hypothetical protein